MDRQGANELRIAFGPETLTGMISADDLVDVRMQFNLQPPEEVDGEEMARLWRSSSSEVERDLLFVIHLLETEQKHMDEQGQGLLVRWSRMQDILSGLRRIGYIF